MGSSTKEAREREARVGMSGCVAGRIINDGEGKDIFMFSISWGGGGEGGRDFWVRQLMPRFGDSP